MTDRQVRKHFTSRYSTPGGYSSKAVHPIALGKVMSIAKMMKSEFSEKMDLSLSGIGGVETGGDAAEFILLGANTVQVVFCCLLNSNLSLWELLSAVLYLVSAECGQFLSVHSLCLTLLMGLY